jgi:hypothetical protein
VTAEECEVVKIHSDRPVPENPPPMGCDLLQLVVQKQADDRRLLSSIDDKLDDICRRHDAHDLAHKSIDSAMWKLSANVGATNESVKALRGLILELTALVKQTAPTMPAPALSTASEPSTITVETR